MPSDTDHGVLRDILRHIELAERFTRGHTFETFNSDELQNFGFRISDKHRGLTLNFSEMEFGDGKKREPTRDQ